jgi:hypothetical protein
MPNLATVLLSSKIGDQVLKIDRSLGHLDRSDLHTLPSSDALYATCPPPHIDRSLGHLDRSTEVIMMERGITVLQLVVVFIGSRLLKFGEQRASV